MTDVVGSTRLWEDHPADASVAFARHDELVHEVVCAHGGTVVRARGEGDSAFCVFTDPTAAVRSALALQLAFGAEPWPPNACLRVRMAVHTGEAEQRAEDYYGTTVNRCARLRAAAGGGQVLVSAATAALAGTRLPQEAELRDLGEHRLKDLDHAMRIHALVHPGLPDALAPISTLDDVRHNLPLQHTTFVGRHDELVAVRKLLVEHPLVTLTGPGGIGKTRLALQAAAESMDDHPDGVRLVELAPLIDGSLLLTAVSASLGMPEGPLDVDAVVSYLRPRRMLVLLDNCEHVLGAATELVAAILSSCPDVRVLATSREPLGVIGERRVPIPPLAMPEKSAVIEHLRSFAAIRLFEERAGDVRDDFRVTTENAEAVEGICRKLDGMPLAIELAAARVAVLAPAQILARLDDRFGVLGSGAGTREVRQRTLHELIAWSHDLLAAADRAVFRRLAVFEGGCTLEAAEAVCPGGPVEVGDVLDLLSSLVDKSLLVVDDKGDHVRYRMLETIRAYARVRLVEAEEIEATTDALLGWLLGFAEAAAGGFDGEDAAQRLDLVEEELPNVRAVLDAAFDRRPADALTLAVALDGYWKARALSEGVAWFRRALDVYVPRDALRSQAVHSMANLEHALGDGLAAEAAYREAIAIAEEVGSEHRAAISRCGLASALRNQGDLAGAQAQAEAALDVLQRLGDRDSEAWATAILAFVATDRGDFEDARRLMEEAIAIRRSLGQTARVADILLNLGVLDEATGHLADARAHLYEGFVLVDRLGDENLVAFAATNLGRLCLAEGDVGAARSHLGRALEVSASIGDRRGIAWGQALLGELERHVGDLDRARHAYDRALELFAELGEGLAASYVRVSLAHVALARRDLSTARTLGERSLGEAVAVDDRHGVCDFLELLGEVAVAEGDAERGAILFGYAEASREELGAPREPVDAADHERWTTEAEASLGAEAYAAAFARGAELTLDEVVAAAKG